MVVVVGRGGPRNRRRLDFVEVLPRQFLQRYVTKFAVLISLEKLVETLTSWKTGFIAGFDGAVSVLSHQSLHTMPQFSVLRDRNFMRIDL